MVITRILIKVVDSIYYTIDYFSTIKDRYRKHLGRYTVKYLSPVGYGGHLKELFKLYTAPLYEAPPRFDHPSRLPLWYPEYVRIYGPAAAFHRFQNELRWAGIHDMKDVTYIANDNGTFHFNDYAVKDTYLNLEYADFDAMRRTSLIADDQFSVGGVGGEHVEFIINGFSINPQDVTGIYRDLQRLNPQWHFTHAFKSLFPINTWCWKIMDRLGRKDLSFLLGFHPFVIEHAFGFNANGNMIPKKYHDGPNLSNI